MSTVTDDSGRPLRVVIIDDTADLRQLLRLALERGGFEVVAEAGDGKAGIETVAAAPARRRDHRPRDARDGRHRGAAHAAPAGARRQDHRALRLRRPADVGPRGRRRRRRLRAEGRAAVDDHRLRRRHRVGSRHADAAAHAERGHHREPPAPALGREPGRPAAPRRRTPPRHRTPPRSRRRPTCRCGTPCGSRRTASSSSPTSRCSGWCTPTPSPPGCSAPTAPARRWPRSRPTSPRWCRTTGSTATRPSRPTSRPAG